MIQIVTDSLSDIRQEEAGRERIVVLPQPVLFGEESYTDGVTITCAEFYRKMAKAKALPKTSQVPLESFVKMFEKAMEAGDEVICIMGSSKLSGTCQGAVLARSMVDRPEDIYVIDSLGASLSQQILVWEAVRLRALGMTVQQIVEKVTALIPRIALIGHIGSLKNLVMGGRLSATKARIATTLNLKPTLRLIGGKLEQEGLTRGTRRANEWALQQLTAAPRDPEYPVMLASANAPEELAVLRGVLDTAGALGADVREVEIGPIIGTHTGQGVLAVAWVRAE